MGCKEITFWSQAESDTKSCQDHIHDMCPREARQSNTHIGREVSGGRVPDGNPAEGPHLLGK